MGFAWDQKLLEQLSGNQLPIRGSLWITLVSLRSFVCPQVTLDYTGNLSSILILFHLRLGLPSGLFVSVFWHQNLVDVSFLLYVPRTQLISFSSILSLRLYMLRRANL